MDEVNNMFKDSLDKLGPLDDNDPDDDEEEEGEEDSEQLEAKLRGLKIKQDET